MATPEELPRFRVALMGPLGQLVSQQLTESAEQAMQAFVRLSKTEFGKDQGRGSYVALLDNQLKLDAAKSYEGFGVYDMRFGKEEGRAAFELIEPSTPGPRYSIDMPSLKLTTTHRAQPLQEQKGHTIERSVDRKESTATLRSSLGGDPGAVLNTISAQLAQVTDDAKTASPRTQAMEGLASPTPSVQRSPSEDHVNDRAQTHNAVSAMNEAELKTYIAAQKAFPAQSDQVLTAARKRIEAEVDRPGGHAAYPPLADRFNVVRGFGRQVYEFRNEPGKIAFTERWLSMQSTSDSPAVVKAMVDRAEERGWSALRVAGSEEFKRQAWIAAEARGIKAVGYEPTQADQAAARQERDRLTKERVDRPAQPEVTGRSITREGSRDRGAVRAETRNAPVMLALEQAMDAKGIPETERDRTRKAVQKQLDLLSQERKAVKVKVFDSSASRQFQRAVSSLPQQQRADRDRAL